jgi:hypothetical protein
MYKGYRFDTNDDNLGDWLWTFCHFSIHRDKMIIGIYINWFF